MPKQHSVRLLRHAAEVCESKEVLTGPCQLVNVHTVLPVAESDWYDCGDQVIGIVRGLCDIAALLARCNFWMTFWTCQPSVS